MRHHAIALFANGHRLARPRGFTLVEVLVTLTVLAVLTLMAWQGVGSMVLAQKTTQSRSNQLLDVQTALAQWRADWDAALPHTAATPSVPQWTGRAVQLLRLAAPAMSTSSAPHAAPAAFSPGVQVVAWAQRDACRKTLLGMPDADGHGVVPCWQRWQSPILRTVGDQRLAWQQAQQWAEQGGIDTTSSVNMVQHVIPLQSWQLQVFTNGGWAPAATLQTSANTPPAAATPTSAALPEAVRVLLTLPDDSVLPGTLTVDWINPTYTRQRH